MIEFNISLANVNIKVFANYETTKKFCRDYLCDNGDDFCVHISQDDIEQERIKSYAQYDAEGRPRINFQNEYLETLALYRLIGKKIIDYKTIIFHGSVVVVNGEAFIFTAKSGTGKTTHTRFYLDNFKDAYVLNGDKPLLRIMNNKVYACGTPWRGKEKYGINEIKELKAICILERGTDNLINEISFDDAFSTLVNQTHRHNNTHYLFKIVNILGELDGKIKFYCLKCNLDPKSAIISYNGMK